MPRSSYLEFVSEQLTPLGSITSRAMFGGYCLYCDGVPFALLANEALFLKVDDVTRPQFEAAGLKAFRPSEDKPGVMQYYEAPAELFESEDGLERWGRAAVDAGRRAAEKKKGGATRGVRAKRKAGA
jgi:DNA transformation protein